MNNPHLVADLIEKITDTGSVVTIENTGDYWFVNILNTDYDLIGLVESSSELWTALERVKNRLETYRGS